MQRWLVCVCLVAVFVSQQRSFAQAPPPLTADRVKRSIDLGIRFLKGRQYPSGNWKVFESHTGGVTSLCTLALLNAGVDKSDITIKRALRRLDSLDLARDRLSVYTVSLMTMIYCQVDPAAYMGRIRECVDYLVDAQLPNEQIGGWAYYRSRGRPDASNSQFALLALHEAGQVGITVDQQVWQRALWYWDSMAKGNGGFIYRRGRGQTTAATGSMTSAAISSLIIIDENLDKPVPLQQGRVVCCGEDDEIPRLDDAFQWMARHFTVRRNPADAYTQFSRNRLYFLYGLERAGRLSGVRFFGKHDWYREGAEFLIYAQNTNGRWQGQGHGEEDQNVATAFALLFLSKGKRPVVIGKYKHSEDRDWNRHRKGVHYLTRTIERDWQTNLNWQTIDGRYATTDDLREAEVLFFSGRDSLRLSADQKQRLREFIEYGGFVVAEACQGDGCGENVGFDQDFRNLMSELFPNNTLQLLSADHPVFNAQYDVPANPEWPLYGLQSSCRTTVIYCPRSLSGFWRLNKPSTLNNLPTIPRREVDYATKLGVNIISYATGREVKDKLDKPKVVNATDDGVGERVLMIPKLTHGGGSDDAPNAWQNIIRQARYELKQRFKVERTLIDADPDQLVYPMVFMHGRTRFQWTDDQRQAIREYIQDRDGFLFADSICSSSAFAESFREEMDKIFPDAKLERIPANHQIWSMNNGGYLLDTVSMHLPDNVPGGVRRFRSSPLVEGIEINGRLAVVFSPHDLSCAMENASATQCAGYDKEDAARIGVNVILYALNPGN